MSYYSDLGAGKVTVSHKGTKPKTVSKDHRAATVQAAAAAAAPASAPSMLPKILLFGGIGVAALIAVKMLKKRGRSSSSPSIALFSTPKVST